MCARMLKAKQKHQLTWDSLSKSIGRDEVATAALFYGQAQPSRKDLDKLATALSIPRQDLEEEFPPGWCPTRGALLDLPPRDPTIYRLFEIVQNYGPAYKSVIEEKFGDGIMSAISFSTHVDKETDEKGDWVKITLRGKFLPYTRF